MPARTQRSQIVNNTGGAIGSTAAPGTSGEGNYQQLVGRKTGRAAPRPYGNGRAPRHESVLADHGLMDRGAADPRQGQLFVPHQAAPREMAAEHGIAPPLASSRPGFMPELYEKSPGGDSVTAAAAQRRMVAGVGRLDKFTTGDTAAKQTNARIDRATHLDTAPLRATADAHFNAPLGAVGNAMRERQATRDLHQGDTDWYATRTAHLPDNPNKGKYDLSAGSATRMIQSAARGTDTSYEQMSRATALTSPRTRWTGGTPGTDDFTAPNIESARNVVSDVKTAQQVQRDYDVDVDYADVGASAHGRALGEAKAKAAMDFVGRTPAHPIPIVELESQKVPNFNQSLLQAHPSQAVRRQAAQSYTVDTHDVVSQGADVDLLKTPAGMAVSRMTGRRTALRNNDLPSMGQSTVWEGQRAKTPEPLGDHSFFEQPRRGQMRVRPEHDAVSAARPDGRSEFAKRMGIEF